MTPTPETDNEAYDDPTPGYAVVGADFARRLERERDEARLEAEHWRNAALDGAGGYSYEDFSWEK